MAVDAVVVAVVVVFFCVFDGAASAAQPRSAAVADVDNKCDSCLVQEGQSCPAEPTKQVTW